MAENKYYVFENHIKTKLLEGELKIIDSTNYYCNGIESEHVLYIKPIWHALRTQILKMILQEDIIKHASLKVSTKL